MVAVDNLSMGRRSNIAHLIGHPRFRFVHADINDRLMMDRVASEAAIKVHLAAAVGVQLIIDRPVHTIETNIMGTEAVLSAGVRCGCKVLVASTSEVYGNGNPGSVPRRRRRSPRQHRTASMGVRGQQDGR